MKGKGTKIGQERHTLGTVQAISNIITHSQPRDTIKNITRKSVFSRPIMVKKMVPDRLNKSKNIKNIRNPGSGFRELSIHG